MDCPYINELDLMDYRFLLVVTQVPGNLPSSLLSQKIGFYLGKFFHRLYILPCRYRYTIHEYWSSWH